MASCFGTGVRDQTAGTHCEKCVADGEVSGVSEVEDAATVIITTAFVAIVAVLLFGYVPFQVTA